MRIPLFTNSKTTLTEKCLLLHNKYSTIYWIYFNRAFNFNLVSGSHGAALGTLQVYVRQGLQLGDDKLRQRLGHRCSHRHHVHPAAVWQSKTKRCRPRYHV